MNFLANENIPLPTIGRLRTEGYIVNAIIEQSPGIDDPTVMAQAKQENAVLLTFDRDYGELVFRHRLAPPAGIVYFRFIPASLEEAAEILLCLLQDASIVLEGQFTVVERQSLRQRPL